MLPTHVPKTTKKGANANYQKQACDVMQHRNDDLR